MMDEKDELMRRIKQIDEEREERRRIEEERREEEEAEILRGIRRKERELEEEISRKEEEGEEMRRSWKKEGSFIWFFRPRGGPAYPFSIEADPITKGAGWIVAVLLAVAAVLNFVVLPLMGVDIVIVHFINSAIVMLMVTVGVIWLILECVML